MTKPDFSKIWGSGGTLLEISDTNFLEGFAYLGDNPPTVEEFNWLFNRMCLQLQYLNTQGEAFFWQASTAYAVGDIAYSTSLPSWARIECVVAGTTGTTEPIYGTTVGVLITDGGVTWIIDDIRDGLSVGSIDLAHVLKTGRIKANGALVNRADYPRLWNYVNANSLATTEALWTSTSSGMFSVGDGSTTFRLPNLIGVFLEGAAIAGTLVAAGLPNITGYHLFRPTAVYGAGSGALTSQTLSGQTVYDVATSTTANNVNQMTIDASKSNAIYGNSTTVQPPAVTMIPQIKY
ncbi:MAG: hypothetical protein H6Q72_4898 [Firmicutes bacterium]|nr:hypothetical protein [Bacillota bacterium]